jgi:hypothetical protein
MKALINRLGKFFSVSSLALALFLVSFLPARKEHAPPGDPKTAVAGNAHALHATGGGAHSTAFSLADSSRLNLLYDSLELDSLGLTPAAFHKAIYGFLSMIMAGEVNNPGVLSIIDFSLPSTARRLFILDTYNGKLLFNTLVAHGRNSGQLMATRFSNRRNSLMSSLGFYLTGDPFIGQHGYSLRLEGMEKGRNDNILSRGIIMHPAAYVSEDHIRQCGILGRSEGCPAIPADLDQPIIDQIKGGSCLFVYSPAPQEQQTRRHHRSSGRNNIRATRLS